jgi:uncharacterized protein (TIGR02391 family)
MWRLAFWLRRRSDLWIQSARLDHVMIQPMTDWTLDADEVVDLPIDDLALRVLLDARDNDEWNWRNWVLLAEQAYRGRPDAVQALIEAWSWLLNRGLVVRNVKETASEAILVSRQGHEALKRGLPWLRAVQRLDVQMVPELEARARPQFLRGDFEAAAFMAMKEVEVQTRVLSGLDAGLLGTKLIQEAFRPPKNDVDAGGPLFRSDVDRGEAVAIMELFKGAIGMFKNPTSHRRIDFDDPTEAAEVILLADLLMRLLAGLPEHPSPIERIVDSG